MIAIEEQLKSLIETALKERIGGELAKPIHLEHPGDISHGDYSTNVALAYAKELKANPVAFAVELVAKMHEMRSPDVAKIEVAGPGFINFYLTPEFFKRSIEEIVKVPEVFGRGEGLKGSRIVIDYTDPNPFKQFHIGHLMSNAIGESVSRLLEWNGADVKRVCYQGDVGRHVALTLWGIRVMKEPFPEEEASLEYKTQYLGKAYAYGATALKEKPEIEPEIQKINKLIYDRSDDEVNVVYDHGKEWSLEHFEELYQKLGTHFDTYIFESVTAPVGVKIVEEFLEKGVFEKSQGAIIFPGEKYDLHTRVFITKEGLPTYEAKDLGLAKLKYEAYPFERSIIVTASEQSAYFVVLIKAAEQIFPDIAKTMEHVPHGMLRLPSGKMSSRTGDVITGESLITDAEKKVEEKMKDRDLPEEKKKEIVSQVAVGAIKYSILKQSPGKDIIFDIETALSFEGDSGPYLQYAYVRACSVLEKAEKTNELPAEVKPLSENKSLEVAPLSSLEKLLYRFPEIIEQAMKEKTPQNVATYLIEIAGAFNSFYANNKILDAGEATSYRIALTQAFSIVMKNGLTVLGVPVPDKM
jgi:arginyl-tRNA synthetase